MPVYNYICNNCGVSFSLIMKKYSKKIKPKCKNCGSRNISMAKELMRRRGVCHNFI
jgi:putative FmdB family regulatory protein